MKTSTAPFFGLKQTNKQTSKAPYLWDKRIKRNIHFWGMASWNDGYICNNLICKLTPMTTATLGASLDSTLVSCPHAPWEQSYWLYHLWCWCATMRVIHNVNVCPSHQLLKQKSNANHLCFPSSLFDGKTNNGSYFCHCWKAGEQSPQSALITAYPIFPRSSITRKGYSEQRGRRSSPGVVVTEDIRENMSYQEEAYKQPCF